MQTRPIHVALVDDEYHTDNVSSRTLAEHYRTLAASRVEGILGLRVMVAGGCGNQRKPLRQYCRSAVFEVMPFNVNSSALYWRCVNCKKRHGKLTKDLIETLVAFVDQYGWDGRTLVICEDGCVRVAN